MAFQASEKERFLGRLLDLQRDAQIAVVGLRLDAKEAEKTGGAAAAPLEKQANDLNDAVKRLTAEIDKLQAQLMEEWLATAGTAMAALDRGSAGIQEAIDSIRKKVRTAENVVRAVGLLDDAVVIARKVLAGGL